MEDLPCSNMERDSSHSKVIMVIGLWPIRGEMSSKVIVIIIIDTISLYCRLLETL